MNISPAESNISDKQPKQKEQGKRWPWILLALLILAGLSALLFSFEGEVNVTVKQKPVSLPLVSVTSIQSRPETIELNAFAEVRPRWSVDLRSSVSGRIIKVHEQALAGEKVWKGALFVEIENSNYLAELAAAEQGTKEASLALWKAQNATRLAKAEFARAKQIAPNDLALKLPQLEIAKSAVKSAKARMQAARKQLEYTKIRAPFDGIVTQRFASPGQSVNVGDQLLRLVDSTIFELTVELSRKEWNLLRKPFEGINAKVANQEGAIIGEATIRKGGGFLDETTRQYKLFLEVRNNDEHAILVGDFINVLLPGIRITSALNIPASALTQEGYVWYVDKHNILGRMEPEILFRKQDRVIVKPASDQTNWNIAITPLVSFLPGQKVATRSEDN